LGLLVAVAAGLAIIVHWPIGVVTLVLLVAWPVLGTLITLDDDMPGGWSNPDGRQIPECRSLRWHADILLCRGSIVVAAFAIQERDARPSALKLAIAAVLMAAVGFPYLASHLRTPSPAITKPAHPKGDGRD